MEEKREERKSANNDVSPARREESGMGEGERGDMIFREGKKEIGEKGNTLGREEGKWVRSN